MKVVTGNQMRQIEKAAGNMGISPLILMENAAAALALHCATYLDQIKGKKVLVFCGPGNNGGDGLACARLLYSRGFEVKIILTAEVKTESAQINFDIAKNLDLDITLSENVIDLPYIVENVDLVLDAVLGTGYNGKENTYYDYIFSTINEYAECVFSVDIPSGILCDSGLIPYTAVRAHKTICLGFLKPGLLLYPGTEYAGELVLADISLPQSLAIHVPLETCLDDSLLQSLPKRAPRSNKGSYGKSFVLAGSDTMPGAAALCSLAIYKSGGGLVKVFSTEKVTNVINYTIREIITTSLPDRSGYLHKRSGEMVKNALYEAAVVILGPGMGNNGYVNDFIQEVLTALSSPVILDADALNVLSENVDILKSITYPCIITPHPGEFSRLTGIPIPEILDNQIELAVEFSREYGVYTVLKDARTVVATPEGEAFLNLTGNASMAKAGSGDVLTGIIGAFLAQGLSPYTACKLGVTVHGKAGELASKSLGLFGVTATDIINNIPIILK